MQVQKKTETKQKPLFDMVVNQSTSQVYLKKMLVIGVSTITYLRGFFDGAAFSERMVADVPVYVLRSRNTNRYARWIMDMIKGAFNAVEKQYLRELVLGIYKDPNDKENSFVEAFSFLFEYGDGTNMTVSYRLGEQPQRTVNRLLSGEDLEQISKAFFRNLVVFCQSIERFDDNERKYLTMKLYYYERLQPPGFRRAEQYECRFLQDRNPPSHFIGSVATRWHTLDLKVKSLMANKQEGVSFDPQTQTSQMSTEPVSPTTSIPPVSQETTSFTTQSVRNSVRPQTPLRSVVSSPMTTTPTGRLQETQSTPQRVLTPRQSSQMPAALTARSQDMQSTPKGVLTPKHGTQMSQESPPNPNRVARVESQSILLTPPDGVPRVRTRVKAQSVKPFGRDEEERTRFAGAKEAVRVVQVGGMKTETVFAELARNVGASLNLGDTTEVPAPSTQGIASEAPSQASTALLESESVVGMPVSEQVASVTSADECVVNCPCGADSYFMDPMIQCDECRTYQHPPCFLVSKEGDLESGHVCIDCSEKTGFYTDPMLEDQPKEKLQLICFTRLLMFRMQSENLKTVEKRQLLDFYKVPNEVLTQVIETLQKSGVLQKARGRRASGKYNVNIEKLSHQAALFLSREKFSQSNISSASEVPDPSEVGSHMMETNEEIHELRGLRKRKSEEKENQIPKKIRPSVPSTQEWNP